MTERRRDYAKEYREYHSKPEQIKNRGMRNAARREFAEAHPHANMKGKDVDHEKALRHGGSNKLTNLELETQRKNRGWNRSQGKNPKGKG